jgi:hypothetical protein
MRPRTNRFRRLMRDPSRGLEYNKIAHNRRVCRGIWNVDIAANPRLVKGSPFDSFSFIDVQAEVDKVNRENDLINAHRTLVEGR